MNLSNNKNNELVTIELSDGNEIFVSVNTEEYEGPVSVQQLKTSAIKLFASVASLAKDLKTTFLEVKPDKATVEFSVEIEKKNNDIVSKIVDFSGKGVIKVTFEWEFK